MEEVLVDGKSVRHADQIHGRTRQNTIVNFRACSSLIGSLVNVRVARANPNSLTGEILQEEGGPLPA